MVPVYIQEAVFAANRHHRHRGRHECCKTSFGVERGPWGLDGVCVACPCDHEPIRTFLRPVKS
jgi:hypothetical protein